MTKKEGDMIGATIVIGIVLTIGSAWVINLFKLIGVAQSQDWGLVVVHGIGLLGPLALITVWF